MKRLAELQAGSIFVFAGHRWIKLLSESESETLALMEDILEERAFDEESNDWRKSELREYLNNYFYETLTEYGAEEKDFLMIETDLTADDGMKDYGTSEDKIALITCDDYRKYRSLIPMIDGWWWTITPWSCNPSYSYRVRCVHTSGVLDSSSAHIGYCGVRPLLNLKSETLVSVEEDL